MIISQLHFAERRRIIITGRVERRYSAHNDIARERTRRSVTRQRRCTFTHATAKHTIPIRITDGQVVAVDESGRLLTNEHEYVVTLELSVMFNRDVRVIIDDRTPAPDVQEKLLGDAHP